MGTTNKGDDGMLLNLQWLSKEMNLDELRARLADFQEQGTGLLGMISSGRDFVGASHSDLEQMLSEVRAEVKKIEYVLTAPSLSGSSPGR